MTAADRDRPTAVRRRPESPAGRAEPPTAAAASAPRRRRLLVVWEGLKFLGGDAVAARLVPGTGHPGRLEPAVPLRVRERPQPAARLEHRAGVLRADAARRGRTSPVPVRRGALHLRETRPSGSCSAAPLGLVAGDVLRPRRGCSSGVRPVRRRQPDRADHRHRAAHRRSRSGRLASVVVDRGDVPDVLPGDDRHDPRPARVRPAGARADALVRGVALGRPAQAPPAGVAAVPVHRLRDRGDRQRSSARSSASCRAASRTAWRADHHTAPVLHRRTREASGRRSSMSSLLGIGVLPARRAVERGSFAASRDRTERPHDEPTGADAATGDRRRPSSRSRRQQGLRAAAARGRTVEALEDIDLDDRAAASSSR